MIRIIDLDKARLDIAVRKGYRNWESKFGEAFGLETRLAHIAMKPLSYLAEGKEKRLYPNLSISKYLKGPFNNDFSDLLQCTKF
jgi:hypothetical protein